MKQVGAKVPLGVLHSASGNLRMEMLISSWGDQWKDFLEKFISELDLNVSVGFWRDEVKTDFKYKIAGTIEGDMKHTWYYWVF